MISKPLFNEPTEYQLKAVRRAILGLNDLSDNLLCSIYIAFQIADRQEKLENLAKNLYETSPENFSPEGLSNWADQPNNVKSIYIRQASCNLDNE